MHNPDFLTIIQNVDWLRLMKNYHMRHYVWEVSKILIPALITGFITFMAMRIIDNKNKKRWLNDGHLKRKTELEIEIRKFLLGIKSVGSSEYKFFDNWYQSWDKTYEESDLKLINNFKMQFKVLADYLKEDNNQSSAPAQGYNSIFVTLDEYVCYVPKIDSEFSQFKELYDYITDMSSVVTDCETEVLDNAINAYLCFFDTVEKILKKISVKKIR